MSRASGGAGCRTVRSTESVVELPARPGGETSTSRPGNSDSTP